MPPKPIAVEASLTCCRFWAKLWASGTWVRMEPFLHMGLILVHGGLVLEYVGYFADLLVVGCGEGGSLLHGAPGMRKEFQ